MAEYKYNGLTPEQRLAILDRDSHRPQMRHYSESRGWYTLDCDNCDHRRGHGHDGQIFLEVHHIETVRNGGMNSPFNLITLGRCEHTGKRCDGSFVDPKKEFVVHLDSLIAGIAYRHGNKQAYKEMGESRTEQVEHGEAYWNTDHDEEMKEIARENTLIAATRRWRFPHK